MKIERSKRFQKDFGALPIAVKKRLEKQLMLLVQNPRHPSLGIRKMEGLDDIWEARVTRNYRFTFQVREGSYILRSIGTHDISRRP